MRGMTYMTASTFDQDVPTCHPLCYQNVPSFQYIVIVRFHVYREKWQYSGWKQSKTKLIISFNSFKLCFDCY